MCTVLILKLSHSIILLLCYLCSYSLSELPECQLSIAMRSDVIDQILAMALYPAYNDQVAIVSLVTIQCLTQSPSAHIYITQRKVIENVLKIIEQKHKTVSQQPLQSQQDSKEKYLMVIGLKYVKLYIYNISPSCFN